ncbi:MAG: polysaccharide deacetylase family protein [Candidatus Korobacteraceae bacterium]
MKWPEDRHLAVMVNVCLEGWSKGNTPSVGPMGNLLKSGYFDSQAERWARYGKSEGMRRLLGILDKEKVKATVLTSAVIAEECPDIVRETAAAGHEVCAHSVAQDILPVYLSETEERENVRRCVVSLEKAAGGRPLGWASPRGTPSPITATLLAENGFMWHAEAPESDMPFIQQTPAGKIVVIPFSMEVNDMPLYIRYGNSPETFSRILARVIEGWYEKHPEYRACLDITVHAHVFGRPYGALEFQRSIEIVKAKPWIWLATHQEVASTVL